MLALTAVLDANGQGREGFEMGPGLDVGLPALQSQPGRPSSRARRSCSAPPRPMLPLQQQVGLEIREASHAVRPGAAVARRRGGRPIVAAPRGESGRCRGFLCGRRDVVPVRAREHPAADRGAAPRTRTRRRPAARARPHRARRRARAGRRPRRSRVAADRRSVLVACGAARTAGVRRPPKPPRAAPARQGHRRRSPKRRSRRSRSRPKPAAARHRDGCGRAARRDRERARVGGEVIPAGGAQTTVTAPLAGTLDAPGRPAGRLAPGQARAGSISRLVPLAPAERDVRIEAERGRAKPRAGRRWPRSAPSVRAARRGRRRQPARGRRGAGRSRRRGRRAEGGARRLALASRGVSAVGRDRARGAARPRVLADVHASAGRRSPPARRCSTWSGSTRSGSACRSIAGDVDEIDRARAGAQSCHSAAPADGRRLAPGRSRPRRPRMPSTAGVDLYYAVDNAAGTLRPGQRVGVRLPAASRRPEPRRAARRAAARRLRRHVGLRSARAARVRPPPRVGRRPRRRRAPCSTAGRRPGTRVVTAGAAELFGTEFGVGK